MKYLMKTPLTPITKTNNLLPPSPQAPPAKFDWRPLGVVTPVKDQEQCGSCWAFSVTENIESVWMINKTLKVADFKPLAPQQIVDCDKSDQGCNGGFPATAYNTLKALVVLKLKQPILTKVLMDLVILTKAKLNLPLAISNTPPPRATKLPSDLTLPPFLLSLFALTQLTGKIIQVVLWELGNAVCSVSWTTVYN